MSKRKKIVPKWRKWETESSKEPWRETEKTSKDEVENETAPRAESRRCGGYTVAYLREKNDLMQKWKMEDMQLQKQRLESESKKEEQSRKQDQDLMQVMLQQTKQQQEHKQNTALKKLLRFVTINAQTTELCKRNANEVRCFAFFVLAKIRRNFAKALANFRWVRRNFAVNLLKFRIHWSERNFRFAEI